MNGYCIVLTTFESSQQAQPVIDQILERKLAACIQVLDIRSHYRWEGEICHDPEVLVLFKTRRDRYDELESALRELHPYETPEIICLDISRGLNDYLSWIDENTR